MGYPDDKCRYENNCKYSHHTEKPLPKKRQNPWRMIPQERNQIINETEFPSLEKYNTNSPSSLRQRNKKHSTKPKNNQQKEIYQEESQQPKNTEKGKGKPRYNEEHR